MEAEKQKKFEEAKNAAMGSDHYVMRNAAVSRLLELDKEAALPVLLSILSNQNEENLEVKGYVALKLGQSGDKGVVPALCRILEKENQREAEAVRSRKSAIGAEQTRGKTAQALGMLADSRAAISLLKALEMEHNLQQSKRELSRSEWPRKHMEKALEEVMLRNGVEYLRDSLEELHGFLDAKNPKVRETTADLLGRLADFRSLDHLLFALEKEYPNNGKSPFADKLVQALESLCDRCDCVEGLRKLEKKVGKTFGRLMECDGVEVQAALRSLETRARQKRMERATLKEKWSPAEFLVVVDKAMRATRQGMRRLTSRSG